MRFSGNLLILEKDNHKRESLETIFSFLGLSCQSGDVDDCISYFDAEESNVDICILGDIDSFNYKEFIISHANTAFLLCSENSPEGSQQT